MPANLTPERKALLDQCVADGWPYRQMYATYGFGHSTLKTHYPDYKSMSYREAGKLGLAVKKTNTAIRKNRT